MTCTRCGTECHDYRQEGNEKLCICCVWDAARDREAHARGYALTSERAEMVARAERAEKERDAALERVGDHVHTAQTYAMERDEARAEVERLRDEVAKLKFARHLGIVSGLEENEG
jgi:hypothetical protein